MEIDRMRSSRDDRMSDCRSFGSNCHPCSQSRKISIGVMVDSSSVKTRPRYVEQEEAMAPAAEKVFSKVNSMGDRNIAQGVNHAIIGKQIIAPAGDGAVHSAKVTTNLPASDFTFSRLNGAKAAPLTYSVQSFSNQMSVLECADNKQKNFDRLPFRREGGKGGTKDRMEECLFPTAQEPFVVENKAAEDKTNSAQDRREALKMKLWDILETVSSPKNRDSQAPELDVNSLNLEQKSKPVVKPSQNTVTIETDCDSPDHTIRRPVTRSVTGKRAPSKVNGIETRKVPSSTYTKKNPKNIFSFEEGFSRRLEVNAAVAGGSPKYNSNKRERKSFKTEARKICFSAKDNAHEIQQATDKDKTTKCVEKTSMPGNRMGSFHNSPLENDSEFVKAENGIQKKGSLLLSAMKMTHKLGQQQQCVQQEDLANSSLKNIVDPNDLKKPTTEIRTPDKSFSPGFVRKPNQGEMDDRSPPHYSFNSLFTSKPDHYETDSWTSESSDDAEELEDSPVMKSDPIMEGKDAEKRLSISFSEERDSKSSGSLINEGRETKSLSPEIGTAAKSKFVLNPTKKLRSTADVKFNGLSSISATSKGTEEGEGLQAPLGHNQEDGLANVISLFVLALERVKNKIKLVTGKKSAEVLMSVAGGINLQLQNAESQMQRDAGKLTGINRSKRKHLETEFEEQQEQLKLIYQKFKAEVNQHLQACRNTVEGFEAQEMEFRGFMEKQKTSQRKLLKQVEEAIESQLSEAQRRITAIHNLGREKMLQLKYVVADCLKESIQG